MTTTTVRRTARYAVMIGLALAMELLANSAVQASSEHTDVSSERLILRLQPDSAAQPAARSNLVPVDARIAQIMTDLDIEGVTFERVIGGDIVVARLAPGTTAEQARRISDRLSAHPAVRYAEPAGRVRPVYVPADPLRTNQWFEYETYGIHAYDAWDIETGASNVVMALVDSGIRTHADLNPARILPGYDFVSSARFSNDGDGLDNDPTDPGDAVAANECDAGSPAENSSWHGLHLAGILLAQSDNNVGVTGLNRASRLLPVRVLGKCGGTYADIIAGILWAAGLPGSGAASINPTPAQVINLSFAAQQACTAGMQDAIDRAVAAGAIVVAAAGNENGVDVANVLPAGCNHVITVAATTRAGDIASYSNVGSRVLISAPGGDGVVAANGIFSIYNAGLTTPGADDYAYLTGTSVAAAQVTAAASLLVSVNPALTLDDVRTLLTLSAQAFPAGGCPMGNCGAGILDMHAAVRRAQTYVASSSNTASSSGGGGGGGGCTLQPTIARQGGGLDITWPLLLAGLLILRRTAYTSRA